METESFDDNKQYIRNSELSLVNAHTGNDDYLYNTLDKPGPPLNASSALQWAYDHDKTANSHDESLTERYPDPEDELSPLPFESMSGVFADAFADEHSNVYAHTLPLRDAVDDTSRSNHTGYPPVPQFLHSSLTSALYQPRRVTQSPGTRIAQPPAASVSLPFAHSTPAKSGSYRTQAQVPPSPSSPAHFRTSDARFGRSPMAMVGLPPRVSRKTATQDTFPENTSKKHNVFSRSAFPTLTQARTYSYAPMRGEQCDLSRVQNHVGAQAEAFDGDLEDGFDKDHVHLHSNFARGDGGGDGVEEFPTDISVVSTRTGMHARPPPDLRHSTSTHQLTRAHPAVTSNPHMHSSLSSQAHAYANAHEVVSAQQALHPAHPSLQHMPQSVAAGVNLSAHTVRTPRAITRPHVHAPHTHGLLPRARVLISHRGASAEAMHEKRSDDYDDKDSEALDDKDADGRTDSADVQANMREYSFAGPTHLHTTQSYTTSSRPSTASTRLPSLPTPTVPQATPASTVRPSILPSTMMVTSAPGPPRLFTPASEAVSDVRAVSGTTPSTTRPSTAVRDDAHHTTRGLDTLARTSAPTTATTVTAHHSSAPIPTGSHGSAFSAIDSAARLLAADKPHLAAALSFAAGGAVMTPPRPLVTLKAREQEELAGKDGKKGLDRVKPVEGTLASWPATADVVAGGGVGVSRQRLQATLPSSSTSLTAPHAAQKSLTTVHNAAAPSTMVTATGAPKGAATVTVRSGDAVVTITATPNKTLHVGGEMKTSAAAPRIPSNTHTDASAHTQRTVGTRAPVSAPASLPQHHLSVSASAPGTTNIAANANVGETSNSTNATSTTAVVAAASGSVSSAIAAAVEHYRQQALQAREHKRARKAQRRAAKEAKEAKELLRLEQARQRDARDGDGSEGITLTVEVTSLSSAEGRVVARSGDDERPSEAGTATNSEKSGAEARRDDAGVSRVFTFSSPVRAPASTLLPTAATASTSTAPLTHNTGTAASALPSTASFPAIAPDVRLSDLPLEDALEAVAALGLTKAPAVGRSARPTVMRTHARLRRESAVTTTAAANSVSAGTSTSAPGPGSSSRSDENGSPGSSTNGSADIGVNSGASSESKDTHSGIYALPIPYYSTQASPHSDPDSDPSPRVHTHHTSAFRISHHPHSPHSSATRTEHASLSSPADVSRTSPAHSPSRASPHSSPRASPRARSTPYAHPRAHAHTHHHTYSISSAPSPATQHVHTHRGDRPVSPATLRRWYHGLDALLALDSKQIAKEAMLRVSQRRSRARERGDAVATSAAPAETPTARPTSSAEATMSTATFAPSVSTVPMLLPAPAPTATPASLTTPVHVPVHASAPASAATTAPASASTPAPLMHAAAVDPHASKSDAALSDVSTAAGSSASGVLTGTMTASADMVAPGAGWWPNGYVLVPAATAASLMAAVTPQSTHTHTHALPSLPPPPSIPIPVSVPIPAHASSPTCVPTTVPVPVAMSSSLSVVESAPAPEVTTAGAAPQTHHYPQPQPRHGIAASMGVPDTTAQPQTQAMPLSLSQAPQTHMQTQALASQMQTQTQQRWSSTPVMRAVVLVDGHTPTPTTLQAHASTSVPASTPLISMAPRDDSITPNVTNASSTHTQVHPSAPAQADDTMARDYRRLQEVTTLQKEVETLLQLKVAQQQGELERLRREMAMLREQRDA